MAPNKRGGPLSAAAAAGAVAAAAAADDTAASAGVISAAEVAARGSGTADDGDTYACHDLASLWRSELRVFFTGLMFLTRLPCPAWCDHSPPFLIRSTQHFPLLGLGIGLWAAVWFQAAAVLWGSGVAAGVSTLATVWLTGCFHEDGLADCLDGFGGGWGRAQILRIMKDSRIGTYALVGMALVLHLKLQALAALSGSAAAALVAAHCASRWSAVPLLYLMHYIQDEEDAKKGLYNWLANSQRLLTPPRLLFATTMGVLVPCCVLGPQQGALVCATVVVVTAAAGYYAQLILGGVVGDYLGATIQVAELACLLVLAADWSGLQAADAAAVQPLLVLAATVALPVLYCRRIVDFGGC